MPKFLVHHGENVRYEPVIIEAETEEAAEDIVRQSQPSDFDPSDEEGEDYSVEATPATPADLSLYREAQVKGEGEDRSVVPFGQFAAAAAAAADLIRKKRLARAGDVAHEIAEFEKKCLEAEYTDTDEAWQLLTKAEGALRACAKAKF